MLQACNFTWNERKNFTGIISYLSPNFDKFINCYFQGKLWLEQPYCHESFQIQCYNSFLISKFKRTICCLNGQRPIYELLVSHVCWHSSPFKPHLSFHILRNNLRLSLCLFLLNWCIQFSWNTYLGTGHFTDWSLQCLTKQTLVFHRFQEQMYAHDWMIKRLSHRLLMYKVN